MQTPKIGGEGNDLTALQNLAHWVFSQQFDRSLGLPEGVAER